MTPVMSHRTAARAVCLAIACVPIALGGCGSTTPLAAPVSAVVVHGAEASVLRVRCTNASATANLLLSAVGTGFVTGAGIVTAAHVVSTCADAGPGSISAGPFVAGVSVDDPADDLALIRLSATGTTPLSLQGGQPADGERVELLGSPGDASNPNVEPIAGTVVQTDDPVTLYSANGSSENLNGTIVVAASGVAEGYSGGPAIDAAGRVIGVIEGGADGRVYLTPATEVASLIS
jgi:S1-C subfamily serine protease